MPLLRGAAVPTAVLAALLVLAGCTQDQPEPSPGPEITESPAVSATATPTPTETPVAAPPPPAELERTDEVGAAAAARYFVSLYPYALRSGDAGAWERMSHQDCGFCSGIREDAVGAAQRGERFEGGEITLADISVLTRDDLIGGYPVDASYSQAAEVLRGPDGQVISTTPANSGTVRIDTLSTPEGWKILAVVVEGA